MTTVVQSVSSTSLGATTKTMTITASGAGNSLIISGAIRAASTVYTGVGATDNQGNTWVARSVTNHSANQRTAFVLDCLAPTAGVTSIVITPTGGGGQFNGCIAVQEVSGINAVDLITTGSYSSSPLALSASGADSGTTDFVVAVISAGNNSAAQGISAPPSGFTNATVNQVDNGTHPGSGQISYRVNSSAVTDSISWAITAGASSGDPAAMVSYKPSASGASLIAGAGLFTLNGGSVTWFLASNFILNANAAAFDLVGALNSSDMQLDSARGLYTLTGEEVTWFASPVGISTEYAQQLDVYDGLDGSLVLAWGAFKYQVVDSYNVYVNGVLNQNVIGLLARITGLTIASYNPSTQVLTPSSSYDLKVVGVINGLEVAGTMDVTVTPGPASIMLTTPMKRLWPFPNTGLD